MRQQIVHSLPQVCLPVMSCEFHSLIYISQEEVADTLYLIVAFLLHDGRTNDRTFEMMNEGGNFPRLVELIKDNGQDETDFHRLLMELVYEMSRMQRLRFEDLSMGNAAKNTGNWLMGANSNHRGRFHCLFARCHRKPCKRRGRSLSLSCNQSSRKLSGLETWKCILLIPCASLF